MITKTLSALVVLLTLVAVGSVATADEKKPRVHEVNQRLKNQKNRVKAGEANGTLTQQQGNKINRQDARINQEKKDMMANDGGHLTKSDQKSLNQQENKVSGEINHDEKANGAGGAAVPAAPPTGN